MTRIFIVDRDGAFYLAMTDLHVFAKRDGFTGKPNGERDRNMYGLGKQLWTGIDEVLGSGLTGNARISVLTS